MTRQIRRIQKHLDLKTTREEQEEDDQIWKDKISEGCKEIPKPTPRRNYEQLTKHKQTLQENLRKVEAEQIHQYQNQMQTITQLNMCIQAINEGKTTENIPLLLQT